MKNFKDYLKEKDLKENVKSKYKKDNSQCHCDCFPCKVIKNCDKCSCKDCDCEGCNCKK